MNSAWGTVINAGFARAIQHLVFSDPASQQIRVHAMVQRYRRNRNTPMQAVLNGFSLELGAVPTSASRWCALFDSVHVSTKNLDGHDAPCSPASLQDGFTGRLQLDASARQDRAAEHLGDLGSVLQVGRRLHLSTACRRSSVGPTSS